MTKKLLINLILLVLTPLTVLAGAVIFKDKQSAWITLCIAVLACIPFFLSFENGKTRVKEMMIIAVMVSLAVVGRIIFTPLPGFKPVTAIVVITAMYFGGEAGFLTGALSAVISDFYFGQGPWTPFQMFVWGLIGFIAGIISDPLKRSRILLAVYGVVSGVLFSLLMDVWTVLWWDGSFTLTRYLAATVSAARFTVVYAVSNVIFLLLLQKPIGKKLERIKDKYGL